MPPCLSTLSLYVIPALIFFNNLMSTSASAITEVSPFEIHGQVVLILCGLVASGKVSYLELYIHILLLMEIMCSLKWLPSPHLQNIYSIFSLTFADVIKTI